MRFTFGLWLNSLICVLLLMFLLDSLSLFGLVFIVGLVPVRFDRFGVNSVVLSHLLDFVFVCLLLVVV